MPMTLVVMRRPSEDSLTICFEPMKNMKALKKRVRELDAGEAAAIKAAKKAEKHVLSEAGRKRIAEGQRKRWAAKKTTGNLGAQPVARKKAKK